VKALLELVRRHRAGELRGIYSVCSAHPLVLRAALEEARASGTPALIEATCNQVNQEGGYTGLRPAGFRDLLWRLAVETGLPRAQLLLGGDHLGPNPWQAQPAEPAMRNAAVMVAEYVGAGFRKIHLDCSMACAGDPRVLGDELIATRTASLCAVAEDAWRSEPGSEPPVYIIGTEVPVPGGAHEALHDLEVTSPAAAQETIAAHRAAFARQGLEAAWERVVGLVAQPGVEFDNERVIAYNPAKARALSASLEDVPRLVFEAHSTDYQAPGALAALVRDHFAILKVGPALTFALREAVWALDLIERDWLGAERSSQVRATVLAAMHADPAHWRKYYHGEGQALELQLQYSLSDRIRYYWPLPAVARALSRLEASFDAAGAPPRALLRQYLPASAAAQGGAAPTRGARGLVIEHVRAVLAAYGAACGTLRGTAS
jgi:D-tagatose-1,6-bisphosphate aldolase subunit GatZ/KbaZ